MVLMRSPAGRTVSSRPVHDTEVHLTGRSTLRPRRRGRASLLRPVKWLPGLRGVPESADQIGAGHSRRL